MDWPATLPSPRLQGSSRGAKKNVLTSNMDEGEAKTRRTFKDATIPYSFAIMMTEDQLEIFDDFLENDIADGSLPFNMLDPIKKDVASWKILPDTITTAPLSTTLYLVTAQYKRQP